MTTVWRSRVLPRKKYRSWATLRARRSCESWSSARAPGCGPPPPSHRPPMPRAARRWRISRSRARLGRPRAAPGSLPPRAPPRPMCGTTRNRRAGCARAPGRRPRPPRPRPPPPARRAARGGPRPLHRRGGRPHRYRFAAARPSGPSWLWSPLLLSTFTGSRSPARADLKGPTPRAIHDQSNKNSSVCCFGRCSARSVECGAGSPGTTCVENPAPPLRGFGLLPRPSAQVVPRPPASSRPRSEGKEIDRVGL